MIRKLYLSKAVKYGGGTNIFDGALGLPVVTTCLLFCFQT